MQNEIYEERENVSIIVFEVGWEQFAIDLLDVKEIIKAGQIRRLPKSLDFIDGIYNYRGEIIHVINLRKKLDLDDYRLYKTKSELLAQKEGEEKKKPKAPTQTKEDSDSKNTYIIIVNVNNRNIGFYVDKIYNVSQIKTEDIVDLGGIFQTSISIEYIKGVIKFEDRPRILMDLSKILTETEQLMIKKELKSLN
ncbi:MAG: Chemotaxis protein CheW [Promethearchaeota archaeon]|jgi:purine-binding chemotaxis protein CheW|nr:MAG: Chemotaxis protein CheW [Candidatus Lokiarchaeota archaeon]